MQSFANAGGANHLMDPNEEDNNLDGDDDTDVSVIELENDDPASQWHTDNACQRWIVIDGIKPSGDTHFSSTEINSESYIKNINSQNEPLNYHKAVTLPETNEQ